MAEIGQVMRGVVVRTMLYGAIVRLEDGCVGLVHISEIDGRYVENVADYLQINARVVVKVIGQREGGRLEFSIKRAQNQTPLEVEAPEADGGEEESEMFYAPPGEARQSRAAFDDKLREFLADSSECLLDLKRHNDQKLGARKK